MLRRSDAAIAATVQAAPAPAAEPQLVDDAASAGMAGDAITSSPSPFRPGSTADADDEPILACPGPVAAAAFLFKASYGGYHGYVALAVCAMGIALNAANVLVLTQRKMRSPVNGLLTLLAITQLLLLAVYAPFDVLVYILLDRGPSAYHFSGQAKAVYVLFYINASVTLHMISSWTTVVTAAFRFVSVQFSLRSATWCSHRRAAIAGFSIVVVCVLCSIPTALRHRLAIVLRANGSRVAGGDVTSSDAPMPTPPPPPPPPQQQPVPQQASPLLPLPLQTWYIISNSKTYEDPDSAAMQLNYWLYALVGKVLPSALLLVLTALLVNLLRRTLSRREALRRKSCSYALGSSAASAMMAAAATAAARASSNGRNGAYIQARDDSGDGGTSAVLPSPLATLPSSGSADSSVRNHARTTRMLLAVVVLFLCVELPHGAMVIAASASRCCLGIYNALGDLIDLLTLVVFSVNFVLYCSTSRQFRQHFAERMRLRALLGSALFQRLGILYGTTLVAARGSSAAAAGSSGGAKRRRKLSSTLSHFHQQPPQPAQKANGSFASHQGRRCQPGASL